MNDKIKNPGAPLPDIFQALADPHRLAIVERLVTEGEKTVGELARPFEISSPAVSRHIAILESAGVIERRVERQWRICRVREDALEMIEDWITRQRRFWNTSLDRLEQIVREREANRPWSDPDE